MFFQESFEYFRNHKYNFSCDDATKLAQAEVKLNKMEDVRVQWDRTDLSSSKWINTWEHKNWILKQFEKGILSCFTISLQKKDIRGNWKTLDALGGIICTDDDFRVYEVEIFLENLKKII